MKISLIAAALAIAAIETVSAADITVVGARDTPMMRSADDVATTAAARGVDVKIATDDILNKPTGLINKNTLAMDNNVFISRSNVAMTRDDKVKLTLAKKVEAMVTAADAGDMSTAVLSKNILKAVSGQDTDTAMMTKASAVVAAKDDAAMRGQRITDLVNTVFDTKAKEQSIQSQTPSGVIMLLGTKDILRQPTAVVNKNVALSDNQIAIDRSNLAPSQNDAVALAGSAKVADVVAPASAIQVNAKSEMDDFRVGFLYNKEDATTTTTAADDVGEKSDEQFFGLGFGWRYPLGYWNLYGAGLYGGGCGLGLPFGRFFYC